MAGIDVVSLEPLAFAPTAINAAYLRAKRDHLGHTLLVEPPSGSESEVAASAAAALE